MSDESTSTRKVFFFNDNPSSWSYYYGFITLVGLGLIVGLGLQIQSSLKDRDYTAANSATWYLVINGIMAFFIYGYWRRKSVRSLEINAVKTNGVIKYLWVAFLIAFSPAFVFVEVWDKLYLVFRKIFKGDQEEFDMEQAEGFKDTMKKYIPVLKTVDLDTSERFTYLFGSLSYDREDAYRMFREGTDIVRTPILVCSFFVTLCLTIPLVITAANGENIEDNWVKNVAPVTTVISGLVLVFILGTLQGYGETVSIKKPKKYKIIGDTPDIPPRPATPPIPPEPDSPKPPPTEKDPADIGIFPAVPEGKPTATATATATATGRKRVAVGAGGK